VANGGRRSGPPIGKHGLPELDNFDYEATATRNTETNAVATLDAHEVSEPTLSVVVGLDAGRIIPITSAETVIGRATSCDLVLPDPGVSRKHARILREGGAFYVEDLESKNGTFVAEQPVRRLPIEVNVPIRIGPHVIVRLGMMTTAERRLSQELYDSSMRDALTKVYNRRYIFDRLLTEIAFHVRHKSALSLVIFDFDHFKKINDSFGHAGGDAALTQGIERIVGGLRTEDVVARVGGEEFAIMLRGISIGDATICAERIRKAVTAAPMALEGHPVQVSISLGVASIDECEPPPTPEKLFAVADRRLYLAKHQGRNRVVREG
jgi:diguanylate cyclase (GGDEF)-like protein